MVETVKASRIVTFRATAMGVGRSLYNHERHPRLFKLSYDNSASGCNPHRWDDYCHEFVQEERCREMAKYAACGWLCDSIDLTTLKVYRIERETTIVTNETEIV